MRYCNNVKLACLTMPSDSALLAQEKQGHGVAQKLLSAFCCDGQQSGLPSNRIQQHRICG